MKSRDENNKMTQNFKILWDVCFKDHLLFHRFVLLNSLSVNSFPCAKSFEEDFLCSLGAVGVILVWLHLASEGKI